MLRECDHCHLPDLLWKDVLHDTVRLATTANASTTAMSAASMTAVSDSAAAAVNDYKLHSVPVLVPALHQR